MTDENNAWRLLDTGINHAAHHMALDKVLIESIDQSSSPSTLRFMRFKPCVLVGYNQVVEDEVNVEFCKAQGLEINRRISGGGAILMEPSTLGWELIGKKDVLSGWGSIEEIYERLCQGCIAAFKEWGVDARFRPHNDIEVNGRKISGAGGTDLGDTFLFHGTILIDFNLEVMLNALKVPAAKLSDKGIASMKERLTWLKRELVEVPTMDSLMQGIVRGFEKILGIRCLPGELNDHEIKDLELHIPQFQSQEWINLRQKKSLIIGSSSYKAPGGLIRVNLGLDTVRQRIQSLMITGDFFAYPSFIINDLEAALKNCSIQTEELTRSVQEFLNKREYHIPGVSSLDLIRAIEQAVTNVKRGI